MLFSIIFMTAIILASSFGLRIMDVAPFPLPNNVDPGQVLYVCPAASNWWDQVAAAIRPYYLYINMFFFFMVMLLVFFWGWALYQNLLKDKFDKGAYTKIWGFTKSVFWLAVAVVLLVWTPNHFRSVQINGSPESWVFCESNTPGAVPVLQSGVKR